MGGDRPVTVHVPPSYDPNKPAPLLILLHGYGGEGRDIDTYWAIAQAADEAGYVYAAPDGTRDGNGDRFWNATDACCNFEHANVDDVAYLSGVIAEIQDKLAIDATRIAVAGHSNGGFMSYRMACDRADVVSAIVSLAGATFADRADCMPSEPVSAVQVHGTSDAVVRFDGGDTLIGSSARYPGAVTTARSWATYDGCGTKPSTLAEKVDVDAVIFDAGGRAETSIKEWSGCDAGSAVQLWTIPTGGHGPNLTPAFADAVLRFLGEHPKP